MCGLCGVLAPLLSPLDKEVFKGLMIVSTLRGEDGAGLAAVQKKLSKDVIIQRTEGTAAELVTGVEFWKMAKNKSLTMLMGHARFPTSGGYNIEDVHPHHSGHIISCHNGTMDVVNSKVVGKNDTDSKMLSQSFAENGIPRTIQNSEGAYALQIIDRRTDLLYLLRNERRPLVIAQYSTKPDIFYWASEASFLQTVMSRMSSDKIEYRWLKPDVMLSFRLHHNQNTGKTSYVNKQEVMSRQKTVVTVPTVPQTKTNDNTAGSSLINTYETIKGTYLSYGDLDLSLASGCAYCERPSLFEDYVKQNLIWIGKHEYVCYDCLRHDRFAREYVESCGVFLDESLHPTHTQH